MRNVLNFITNILKHGLLLIIIFLATAAFSNQILMQCNNVLFKFDNSIPNNPKVFYRSEASWSNWCSGKTTVNDLGAWCDYTQDQKKEGERKQIVIDSSDIEAAKSILMKRHKWCSDNNRDPKCDKSKEINASVNIPLRILMEEEFKLMERKGAVGKERIDLYGENPNSVPPITWYYQGCSGNDFTPFREKKNFYNLPLESYLKFHMPKLGEFKCLSEPSVSKAKIEVRETLDFLLFEQRKFSSKRK